MRASWDSFSRAAAVPSLIWEWLREGQTWLRTNHGMVLAQKSSSPCTNHYYKLPISLFSAPRTISILSVFLSFQRSLPSCPLCVAYPLTALFHAPSHPFRISYISSPLCQLPLQVHHTTSSTEGKPFCELSAFPTQCPSLLLKVYHHLLMAPTALGLHRREPSLPSQPLASL